MNKLMKVAEEMVRSSIMECSKKYNFDGEEALREILGLSVRREKNEKKDKKEKKEKEVSIPLPFSSEEVKESGCQGLKYNHGLFTQCENERDPDETFCSVCKKETELTPNKMPYCGTVSERKKVGLMEYRDKNGRKPIGYLEVLKKKNIEKEVAIEYMSTIRYKYDKVHLETDKKEGRRGRPKKEGKAIVISDVEDLFAKLVIESPVEVAVAVAAKKEELFAKLDTEPLDSEINIEDVSVDSITSSLTNESNKKEKKESKKAEKEAKKAEKETKKTEKESKKAEKESKKAEKEAKKTEKESKKAEKESKKAEKDTKKAEKETKKTEKEADKTEKEIEPKEKEIETKEKVIEPKEKEIEPKEKENDKSETNKEEKKVEEAAIPKVKVKRIEINGKEYLLSNTNILYDATSKDEVGIYCGETNTIKELPDDDDSEIEEEEYEDSDEE